jgi:hypothetical protein
METLLYIIFYFVVFWLTVRLLWWLFAPMLGRYLLRKVAQRLQAEYLKTQNQTHGPMDPSVQKQVHLTPDTRLEILKTYDDSTRKRPERRPGPIEDVEL